MILGTSHPRPRKHASPIVRRLPCLGCSPDTRWEPAPDSPLSFGLRCKPCDLPHRASQCQPHTSSTTSEPFPAKPFRPSVKARDLCKARTAPILRSLAPKRLRPLSRATTLCADLHSVFCRWPRKGPLHFLKRYPL